MLDVTRLLREALAERLREGFKQTFGTTDDASLTLLIDIAEQVIQTIAESNTLYHNVEHTVQVTLVGQAILQGKALTDSDVDQNTWLNFMMALLCHDIGYVQGICDEDSKSSLSNGAGGTITNLSDASDAALMPYHVDRGLLYIKQTFGQFPQVNLEFIKQCIERTRFPAPDLEEYKITDDFPGLVRGADLIGQMSDPRYLKKLPAVFFEFEESGFNAMTGYRTPGDLLENYTKFYAESVEPYVKESLFYLSKTKSGNDAIKSLNQNIEQAKDAATKY